MHPEFLYGNLSLPPLQPGGLLIKVPCPLPAKGSAREITIHTFNFSGSSSRFRLSFNVQADCFKLWVGRIYKPWSPTHTWHQNIPFITYLILSSKLSKCLPVAWPQSTPTQTCNFLCAMLVWSPTPPPAGIPAFWDPLWLLPSLFPARSVLKGKQISICFPSWSLSCLPLQIIHPGRPGPCISESPLWLGKKKKNAGPQVPNLGILFQ